MSRRSAGGVTAAVAALALLTSVSCATRQSAVLTSTTSGYLDQAVIGALANELTLPTSPPTTGIRTDVSMDRWWLATLHAELSPPLAAQHFDCALGVRFMEQPRPALTRVMSRLAVDVQAAVERASHRTFVPKPIKIDPSLQPCQRVTPNPREATAWPAAGGAVGAAYGELMAALAPDRADQARRVGLELGYSRLVCRMNGPGDVADGRDLGLRVYGRAAETPEFAADLALARAEVAAARAQGLSNPGCAAERRAYGDPAWGLRPAAG